MKIVNLTEEYYNEFLEFNKKAYPRVKAMQAKFEFQFLNNPLLESKLKPNVLIALNEHNHIIGQFILNPVEYFYNGQKNKCYVGSNLYISEQYRNRGIGVYLVKRAITKYRPYFAIGVAPLTKKIHIFFNIRVISSLKKFLWIRGIFSLSVLMKVLYKKVLPENRNILENSRFRTTKLPDELSVNNLKFFRVHSLEDWREYYWDKSIIEFSRSQDFLKWRFLKMSDIYYFYLLNDNSETYFVVRKSNRAGLNLLAIVDYRIPFRDDGKFQLILKAAKLLVKLIGFDGIVAMSSLSFFDKELRKSLFFRRGQPYLIMTNARGYFNDKAIDDRNICYATMADSDTDFYFDQAAGIFG